MSDLIVISYPDEATGQQAYEEAQRLAADLVVEYEALGLVLRDPDGKTKVETPQGSSAGQGAIWGVLFGTLFGLLLFIPIIGLVIGGAFGAMFGALDKSGIDKAFRDRLKEQLQPGTSALVMVIAKVTPDKAIEAMSKYGGTVLQTSLSHDAEERLQEALHGQTS
jgi:uncharacterized membrane protein